jgi:hypothetical protein
MLAPDSRLKYRSVPEERRTTRVQCYTNELSSNKLNNNNKSAVFHITCAQKYA